MSVREFPRSVRTPVEAVGDASRDRLTRVSSRSEPSPGARFGKVLVIVILVTWTAGAVLGFQTSLFILTVVGFLTAVFGLKRPAVGLLGVSILCTLDSVTRLFLLTGGLWRYNTFNYWLLIVMLLSIPFILGRHDTQSRLLEFLVLLLAVELVFSSDPAGGIQHVLNVATIFGLLVYLSRAPRTAEQWYWVAVVNGLLAGMGSLLFYVREESLPEVNPNAWSFFPLTAIFCITLSFAVPGNRKGRLLRALLAGLNGAWVFLSGSRGSFLIAVCCFVFIVVQLGRSGRMVPILGVVAAVAIVIASEFGGQESYAVHRFNSLFDPRRPMTNRTSGRSDLATGGWRIFIDHPLGVGTGGFPEAWKDLPNREGLSGFREGEFSQAHSGWIKVLTENGVPGIVLLGGYVLSFAVVGWRRRSRDAFLLGLLVTVSLSVAFLADEFQGKGLWFLAATAMTFLSFWRTPGSQPRPRERAPGPQDRRDTRPPYPRLRKRES
jgi:hypothetical protein